MKFEWKYNTFFKKNILKKYRLENVTRFHLVWHISPAWVTIYGIPLRVKTFIYVLFVIFSFWKAMNDVNSLSPGIRGRDFKHVNFKHNLGIDILSIQVKPRSHLADLTADLSRPGWSGEVLWSRTEVGK